GRPHAEPLALAEAGEAARGATAYVTLEPCAHHGRTPPCAEALIAAGVARVVVACGDPDPRVSGRGLALLRAAGIAVTEGVLTAEAEHLNAGFLKRVREGLPLVTLKLATTLDGRIATATGESQWITGPEARRHGHYLRATHDAILVGRGTAAADNPSLTCRLAGLEDRSPVRIVLDSQGRLPAALGLFSDGAAPTWRLAGPEAPPAPGTAESVTVPLAADGSLDPRAALAALADRGIGRVLVEGGAETAASLLRAGLVDRIAWFRAPALIGADGLAGVGDLGIGRIVAMQRFALQESHRLGDDTLEFYERKRAL
ncbi:MAG: bifunctional diaminohydroxyphosphoribosylaminopyrimidine deaminase/5-amino-6-(5-phosphoribosylamino)uracil reductase RibD, partial [Alphaproteobacteria bacterium]|nr:bifunctional diaminohydroxyphosphoribosylaminopyrimidine deaminase/5-amino-6-(5-phosphoribosylamino)uracil reductase RibD [Alphaproteobacteria bacterium]